MPQSIEKDKFIKFISFDPSNPTSSAEYYFKAQSKSFTPNWIALLFGTYWFLYRRMYLMFLISYFVVGYSLQNLFAKMGYDPAASSNYSSMLINVLIVFFGTPFYLWFVKIKIEKINHLGTHVRLFYPFVLLVRNIFALLIIQILGIFLHIDFLVSIIYPFLWISLAHMFAMYMYYSINWIRLRRAS